MVPIRELLLTAKICAAVLQLAQRHIHFGSLPSNETRSKIFNISNFSEVPIVYRIEKTHSFASLDLHIPRRERTGLVLPYSTKVLPAARSQCSLARCVRSNSHLVSLHDQSIEFKFRPTLAGEFLQILTVVNIFDESSNQQIKVRANVLKPKRFFLKSLKLDFGVCLINHPALPTQITLVNTNKHRTFRVEAVPNETKVSPDCSIVHQISFALLNENQASSEPQLDEESIAIKLDELQRKLRIYTRKANTAQIDMLQGEINKIQAIQARQRSNTCTINSLSLSLSLSLARLRDYYLLTHPCI